MDVTEERIRPICSSSRSVFVRGWLGVIVVGKDLLPLLICDADCLICELDGAWDMKSPPFLGMGLIVPPFGQVATLAVEGSEVRD